MTTMINKKAGDFCWMELATSDLTKAKTFYSDLFAWQGETHNMSQGGEYAMMGPEGSEIAGGFEITNEMREQGMAPHWNNYVHVANVDEMIDKAASLGATILMTPTNIGEHGRMAVFTDPTGAVLSLWQPKDPNVKQPTPKTPGMFSWNELATDDTEKAKTFYCDLFGWTAETQMMGEMEYTAFSNQGTAIAGMLAKQADWEIPNCWCVYFTVSNIDNAIKEAARLGGKAMMDVMTLPGVGKLVMISDPQDSLFFLIEYA
jgi:uncharacterized protein